MTDYRFATAEHSVLPLSRASVLFDGLFSEPRLQHPECVAVGPDGWVWCGSENGQILRIAPDGSAIEEVASTGGFTLGLAFDADRALYACDQRHAAVFKLDLATRALSRFTQPGIRIPNYPVIDARRGRLYVSDSFDAKRAGPGIWAYDLATGAGSLWYDRPLVFANGMALSADGDVLYVCETFAQRVSRIAIDGAGRPALAEPHAENLPGLPDGMAIDDDGGLYISCYEPSRILRVPAGRRTADVYIEDPTAHVFAHPTNIAFDGSILYAANLGRWHVTRVETDTFATPLWRRG